MFDYRIRTEPRGDQLRALMSVAMTRCNRFLVALSGMALADLATETLARLDPFRLSTVTTSEYPAGVLPWGSVEVRTYRLTPESTEILVGATDRLFNWLEPDLPSDLCLLRDDEPWLITMSSDRVAILVLDDREATEMERLVPGLRLDRSERG